MPDIAANQPDVKNFDPANDKWATYNDPASKDKPKLVEGPMVKPAPRPLRAADTSEAKPARATKE